jgi:hypothetical protein
MRQPIRARFSVLAILLMSQALNLGGCSGCAADEGPSYDGHVDGDAPPDSVDLPSDPTTEWDTVDFTDDAICAEDEFSISRATVRLMLLLDQSSSMTGSKWTQATDALEALLRNPAFYDMHFGLDAFPDGYPGFWTDCGTLCLRCREDECGTLAPPQVAVGPQYETATHIINHMNDSSYPQFCTFTPLVNQMEYYDTGPGPTDAPEMYLDDGDNYLVVISDGEDEGCFSGDPVSSLGTHTSNILDDHGLKSIAIGFGSTSGSMAAELNAIASNGGTDFTTFLHAEDGSALEAALDEIASTVITCTYVLDDPGPSADPTKVNFYLDGEVVPMDEDCTEDSGSGWHWVVEYTTMEFCGDICDAIKAGEFETITATWGCDTILI